MVAAQASILGKRYFVIEDDVNGEGCQNNNNSKRNSVNNAVSCFTLSETTDSLSQCSSNANGRDKSSCQGDSQACIDSLSRKCELDSFDCKENDICWHD